MLSEFTKRISSLLLLKFFVLREYEVRRDESALHKSGKEN